jgi:hypothetical protein
MGMRNRGQNALVSAAMVALLLAACSRGSGNRPPTAEASPPPSTMGPDGIPLFELYNLGADAGSSPFGLHVDKDSVFWVQKDTSIYRGSRDGQRPAERWAALKGVYADTMASDEQRLYWLERDKLRFKNKLAGEEGQVTLSWDHTGGALAVDGTYVLVGMIGCPAITRVNKQTLASEVKEIPGVEVDPRGGGTTLLLSSSGLYCGAWGHVFQVPDWQSPARRIADSAYRLWGLAVIDDSLYWLNNPGFSSTKYTYVSRVVVTTGAVSDFPGPLGRGASNLITSPDGKWLFFTADTQMWAFSTTDHRYLTVIPADPTGRRLLFYGRNLAADGEALYYLASREGDGGRVQGVHKVPFSYLLSRLQ